MATEPAAKRIGYFRADALADRVVLVTGGASGIGFEIGQQFALHGAKAVVIMGRREKFVNNAVGALRASGLVAEGVVGDVRNAEACAKAVDFAVTKFGALDVLVNAAAGNFLAVAEELSQNGFKTVMDIDALGTFTMTRAAFNALKASKFGGVVTSITATLHYTATWYQTAPVAAKAAIEAMSRNLALEWGDYRIRCNCIAPGPIKDTPGFQKLAPEAVDSLPGVPLARPGTKAEIASACLYLCLNEYITGQVLVVDGGEWFGKDPFMSRETVKSFSRGIENKSRAMGVTSKL